MSRPDGLAIMADIVRVAAEYPELGEDVVGELRGRLRWRQPHEPTLDELRAYVERVSPLGVDVLRLKLGLDPYPVIHLSRRAPEAEAPGAAAPGRGRPRGTGLLTVAKVRETYRAIRAERGRKPTQQELASRLDVAVRSLQRFLKRHDMEWPLGE
jgi:hypothetical protein